MSHDDHSEFLFWLLLDLFTGEEGDDPFTGPIDDPPGSRDDARLDGHPSGRPPGEPPDEPRGPPSPLDPRDLPGTARDPSSAASERPGPSRNRADGPGGLPVDPGVRRNDPADPRRHGNEAPVDPEGTDGGRGRRGSPLVARRETGRGLRVTADLRGTGVNEVQTAIEPETGALVLRASGAFLDQIPLDGNGWTIADVSLNNGVYEVTLAAE